MAKRNITIDVDFAKKDTLRKFSIKQFDNVNITINTLMNEVAYNPVGSTCNFFVGINKDIYKQEKNIQVQENKIIIDLDKNIINKSGMAYAELELTDSKGVMTSSTFIFIVEPKIGEGATMPGNIEGFVAKYERLIKEFKQQVDSTVKDCNDRVDNKLDHLQTDYNTTKNEVVKKTDDKIIEVENRFNQLTAQQQQDSEVIDARDGEVSLKARLERDKQALNTRISEIDEVVAYDYSSENNYINIKNSKAGTLDNVRVEGDTVVNLIGSQGKNSFTLNSTVKSKLFELVQSIPANTNIFIRVTVTSKKAPRHGLRVNVRNEDGTFNYFEGFKGVYDQTIVINHHRNITHLGFYMTQDEFTNDETANITFEKTQVTLKNVGTSYFEGLKSVGDDVDKIEVLSCNKNLFSKYEIGDLRDRLFIDFHYPTISNYNFKFKYSGTFQANTIYIGSTNIGFARSNNGYVEFSFSLTSELISKLKNGDRLYIYRGEKDIVEPTEIHVNLGTQATQYQPHKSHTKQVLYKDKDGVWKKPILRKWHYIEQLADGSCKYHKGSDKYVLNGSENWTLTNTNTKIIQFQSDNALISGKKSSYILSDRFIQNDATDIDEEGISSSSSMGSKIYIRILKTKLTTQDVQGFKAWLQDNPVTVVYQLAQEEVYDCIDLSLNSYEGETSVFTNSSIPHGLSVTQKQGLKARVETLEQEMKFLYDNFNYALKQLLAGDMQSLAYMLYPQDFENDINNNTNEDIPTLIPELK